MCSAHAHPFASASLSIRGGSPGAQKIKFCIPNQELKEMNMFTQNEEFSYRH